MRNPIGPLLLSMLFFITFLLLSNYAFGKNKSQWLNENPCMIKTITTSVTKDGVTTITKEEVLKCQDGYDGPNYWELFAQFIMQTCQRLLIVGISQDQIILLEHLGCFV